MTTKRKDYLSLAIWIVMFISFIQLPWIRISGVYGVVVDYARFIFLEELNLLPLDLILAIVAKICLATIFVGIISGIGISALSTVKPESSTRKSERTMRKIEWIIFGSLIVFYISFWLVHSGYSGFYYPGIGYFFVFVGILILAFLNMFD